MPGARDSFHLSAQDLDGLPPEIVEDAYRYEETGPEASHIEVTEDEGRFPEAAELTAEARLVQPVLSRGRERDGAHHGGFTRSGTADEREWPADRSQDRDVHSRAFGLPLGGHGGKALTGAGEQRGFG